MITVGTKVAIMPGADYAGRFVGHVGVVNPDSEYGVFWFKEQCLAVIPDSGVLVNDAIQQIIFSGPKTIVIWKDGTKTIVSCGEGDQYDRYIGFCAAVTKKMFGSTTKIKKTIDLYTKEGKKC